MKKGFTLFELLVFICILGVLTGVGFGIIRAGKRKGEDAIRVEAIKMGVARWTVADERGNTEFKWNSPKAPGYPIDPESGVLAYMKATNEFGVVEVRWTPLPRKIEPITNLVEIGSANLLWRNVYLPPSSNWPSDSACLVSPDHYVLRLKDLNTGKETDVFIPICTNPIVLNYGSTVIPLNAR